MGARIFCVFVLAKYSDDRIVDFTPVFLPRFPPSIKKGANLISRLSGKWGEGTFFSPLTGNPPDLWENLSSPDLLQNRIEIKDYGLQSSRDIRYRCYWKIHQSEASLSDFSQSEDRYKRLRMSVTWSAQSCVCLSWWPRLAQDSEESLDEVCNLTQEFRLQTLPSVLLS